MAVRIRLARGGAKKRPFYRVVAANATAPRDGDFIEKLGTFNPMLPKDSAERIVLNEERIRYWLGAGASPSERVETLLVAAGIAKRSKKSQAVLDNRIARQKDLDAKKKAEEEAKRKAEEAEAKAAAEAEAAAAAPAAEGEQAAS